MMGGLFWNRMYTDWTAVALLLFTTVPLLAVVATAAFFIWQQRRSNSCADFHRQAALGRRQ